VAVLTRQRNNGSVRSNIVHILILGLSKRSAQKSRSSTKCQAFHSLVYF